MNKHTASTLAGKIALILTMLALAALFFYLDIGSYLTIENLKANRLALLQYNSKHPVLLASVFMAIYIVQTGLSLPGATILSISAGVIFGPFVGTAYAVIAASTGASIAFLATRHLFRDLVASRFGKRLEPINRELEERGLNYLLFMRLVPIFPFFLINLSSGLTRLPFRTFLLGTFFGIIPGGFLYVNAGSRLASINSPAEIASPAVLGSLLMLGLFAMLPALCSKFRKARRNEKNVD